MKPPRKPAGMHKHWWFSKSRAARKAWARVGFLLAPNEARPRGGLR